MKALIWIGCLFASIIINLLIGLITALANAMATGAPTGIMLGWPLVTILCGLVAHKLCKKWDEKHKKSKTPNSFEWDSDSETGNTPRITYANLSKEELLEAANRVYCSPYKLIVKEIPDEVLSTCYLRRENEGELREYLASCVNNGTIPQTYADILFDRYTNGLNVGNAPKVVHNYAYANESVEELTEIAKQKDCTPYKLIEKEIPEKIINQCYLRRVNKSELQEYLASCVKNGSIPQTYADIILDRFS